jgi:hypothetical protein
VVTSQPGQIVPETLSRKYPSQKKAGGSDCPHETMSRALVGLKLKSLLVAVNAFEFEVSATHFDEE